MLNFVLKNIKTKEKFFMEVRHISRKKKKECLNWLEDCERYTNNSFLDLMPNLDYSQYNSLRKQGDRLFGNFETLYDSVCTPQSKNEKKLFMEDIDLALNIVENCHKRRKYAEDIQDEIVITVG